MGVSTSILKQVLPRQAIRIVRPLHHRLEVLRYEWDIWRLHVNKNRLLILATIPKAGRTYMKFLLANYLRLVGGTGDGPLNAREMELMLPNRWDGQYWGGSTRKLRTPTPHLKLLGLQDTADTHMAYRSPFWDGSRVLHMYRNPLDFAVSRFFYGFEFLPDGPDSISGPVAVLDRSIGECAEAYLSFREVVKAGHADVFRLSYEDLIRDPQVCFTTVLKWLGVDADPHLVEVAAQYSSKDNIAQLEEESGDLVLTVAMRNRGVHLRDGSIGQWKKYFDSSDLARTEDKMNSFGISLDEFTLEA